MSDLLKLVIAAGVAAAVGLIIGLVIGLAGKGDLEQAATAAKQRAGSAETALKEERSDCERKLTRERRARLLLLTEAHLLRALNELHANNYGLASQQLANARTQVARLKKSIAAKERQRVAKLFDQLANTQTLVMRLDPMARKYLQDLLHELQAIPGAR